MKHIHAELMMQYAQDAMETDKPWERWEIKATNGVWHSITTEFSFYSNLKYRRKPNGKTVMIDGQEFIVPKSFKPEAGEFFWFFDTDKYSAYKVERVVGKLSFYAKSWGNCYRTEKEAEQALAFWMKINEV